MSGVDALKKQIAEAFANVERPGDWALRNSNEGEEPQLLERELAGKGDWRSLDATFIDRLPSGYGSALSFFSDEAFRHFLPAYLIADLDGLLRVVDPTFYLCHGLDTASRDERVNPRRFGARTWFDVACARFSVFSRDEAKAIVAYLEHRASQSEYDRATIDEALGSYWHDRARGG
jgi:hypothetical protein